MFQNKIKEVLLTIRGFNEKIILVARGEIPTQPSLIYNEKVKEEGKVRKEGNRFKIMSLAFVLMASVSLAAAQDSSRSPQETLSASPVFTGFITQSNIFSEHGEKHIFDANPVLLIPVGKEGLFLTEWELGYGVRRENGTVEKEFEYELEYLQFDQPFSKRFTGVFGKFLTPGMWNERLHPSWIKKTPDAPFTAGLLPGSGTGLMLRGALPLSSTVNLTYSPFFTVATENKYLSSKRMTGGRIGTFFKKEGIDLGFLAARLLENERTNIYGVDLTYQLRDSALDLRSEYYRSYDGSAYWTEVAKLFKNGPWFIKRRLELAARFEQSFVSAADHREAEAEERDHGHNDENEMEEEKDDHHGEEPEVHSEEGGHHGVFPEADTDRFVGTVNYYFRDGFKLYLSFGREILPGANKQKNVWNFGLAFRFLK